MRDEVSAWSKGLQKGNDTHYRASEGAGCLSASSLTFWSSLPIFKCPFTQIRLGQRALVKELPLCQRNFLSEMGMILLALKGSCEAQRQYDRVCLTHKALEDVLLIHGVHNSACVLRETNLLSGSLDLPSVTLRHPSVDARLQPSLQKQCCCISVLPIKLQGMLITK